MCLKLEITAVSGVHRATKIGWVAQVRKCNRLFVYIALLCMFHVHIALANVLHLKIDIKIYYLILHLKGLFNYI